MVREPTGPGGCGLPTILLGVRQQKSPAAGALRSRLRSLRVTTQESRQRRVGALQPRPFFLCPYSSECVGGLFSEVRGSKLGWSCGGLVILSKPADGGKEKLWLRNSYPR